MVDKNEFLVAKSLKKEKKEKFMKIRWRKTEREIIY